jgi:hypothetical protein
MKLEQIIKLKFNNFKIDLPKKLEGDLEGACWPGYEAIGTKELDGKTVPNCVPVKASKVVKEGFPIPSPSGSEKEDEYISKCISAIIDEYPAEGQAYAICKGEWDK